LRLQSYNGFSDLQNFRGIFFKLFYPAAHIALIFRDGRKRSEGEILAEKDRRGAKAYKNYMNYKIYKIYKTDKTYML